MNKIRKIFFDYRFFSLNLVILSAIQKTQVEKNIVMIFAAFVLYVSVFCALQYKKLGYKSIEGLQSLVLGCGIFLLSQFFFICHNKYEYFLLIVWIIAVIKIANHSKCTQDRLVSK